ncbi:MAG: aminotransferase class IV [Salinirussus sp.]
MVWDPFADDGNTQISVDGDLVPAAEATISVFDRGFLYGDAVYDSMPIYDGRVLLMDRHIDRLYRSAAGIQVDIPQSKEALKEEMLRTAAAGDVTNGALRVMVSRGAGPPGVVNADRTRGPTVIVAPLPSPPEDVAYGRDDLPTGRARIVSTRAIDPDSIDSKIKSNNYLTNALAERELVGTDAEFGIMLDHDGFVAEEFVSNVFVRDQAGRITTPPPTHALDGITRQLVLEIGEQEGYDMAEERVTPAELYAAEDIFLTASARGIVAVSSLNSRLIGDGEPSEAVSDLAQSTLAYARTEEAVPIGD